MNIRDALRRGDPLPPIAGGDGTTPEAWTKEQLRQYVLDTVGPAIQEALKPLAQSVGGFGALINSSFTKKPDTVERGIRLARTVKAIALAREMHVTVQDAAKQMYPNDEPLAESLSLSRQKALGESLGTAGGFLVPPEYSAEIIEFLRDASVIRKAGARIVPMNSNTLSIPRQDTGASASYIGESQNIGKTEPTFGMIQLSAKKLAALTPISNELIRDSSSAADAFVRDDLVRAMATREDLAFIRGLGTQFEPKGIRYWTAAGNVTTANTTVSLANTVADLKTAVRKFKQGRKGMLVRPFWFMSTRTEQYLMHLTTGAPERYFFRDEMLTGKFFGYPYGVTDQIPDNIGATSVGSELYLVDMWECLLAENATLEVAISSEAAYYDGTAVQAAFSRDETVIRTISRHDFALRHALSAHILDDVRWS